MLEIQQINKRFAAPNGAVQALRDVTFRMQAGEFTAVQGPSGCGKTTLLLTLGALLTPDSGRLTLDEQDPYALAPEARAAFRARHVGFVFQQFFLVPYLTVLENILAPTIMVPRDNPRGRAVELAEQFGLADRLHHCPAALSTGERQRTALARALINDPVLLLADEPTGNLDEANAPAVMEALTAYARRGKMVLMVTHDSRAAHYAQRFVHMEHGSLLSTDACAV